MTDSRPQREYDLLYRCQVCHTWKVVPQLARDCEARHAAADGDDTG